jgi:two-component system nitrogen regulation sensor histidine kinase NtrY
LDESITNVVSKYKLAVPENISIKFSSENDLPIIEADPEQLETILCNLIDNAIRAVNQKGKIEIRSCLIQKIELERHVDFLQVEIEDNGIGIAEDGLKNIFDPYVTGNKDGTGLGLAIVKRIVENHKGFISINSKKNIGTLVTVQLPVKFTGK